MKVCGRLKKTKQNKNSIKRTQQSIQITRRFIELVACGEVLPVISKCRHYSANPEGEAGCGQEGLEPRAWSAGDVQSSLEGTVPHRGDSWTQTPPHLEEQRSRLTPP